MNGLYAADYFQFNRLAIIVTIISDDNRISITERHAAFAAPAETSKQTLPEHVTYMHARQSIGRILPPESVVSVTAENKFGRVVWVDFDKARQHGFDVPPDNRMTPAFHTELIDRLSYKVSRDNPNTPREDQLRRHRIAQNYAVPSKNAQQAVPGGKCRTALVDRYSDPMTKGSGRAIFIDEFCIKGAGVTPLAAPANNFRAHLPAALAQEADGDELHGYTCDNPGTCSLYEGMIEALAGKISHNLLTQGSTEVLALIDVGDRGYDHSTKTEQPQALIIRTGNHIRPAHATFRNGPLDGRPVGADSERLQHISVLPASILPDTLAQAHACGAAEQLRWRLLHGVLGDANNGLYGEMMDHGFTSTQCRTAPVHAIPAAGMEAARLRGVPESAYLYRLENRNRQQILKTLHPDAGAAWKPAYARAKTTTMLQACGMKPTLAKAFLAA